MQDAQNTQNTQQQPQEECGCLVDQQLENIHGLTGGEIQEIDQLADQIYSGGFIQNNEKIEGGDIEQDEMLDIETLVEGGKRRKRQDAGSKSRQLLTEFQIKDSGYKLDVSFQHLTQMLTLYTNALKAAMSEQQGSRDVADDIAYLLLGQSENRMRSLFIKWSSQVGALIHGCKTQVCKRKIQGISNQMSNLSREILNERIPNFEIYIQDVAVMLNEYKKNFKDFEIVTKSDPIRKNIDSTIQILLQNSSDKKKVLLDEFTNYDQRLFDRIKLEVQKNFTPNSDEYKGFNHFMTLRQKTMQTFIYKLQEYENALKYDIEKYKNNRPSEKQYTQLVRMYNELQDQLVNSSNGRAYLDNVQNIFNDTAIQRFYSTLRQRFQNVDELVLSDANNTDKMLITEANIDAAYKTAFQTIYALINNYTFLLRYCDATKLMTMQFHAQGFDIKRVIVDIIANWYLLLYFVPGKDRIYIRKLTENRDTRQGDVFQDRNTTNQYDYGTGAAVPVENSQNVISWSALTQYNAEYKFFNSLSNITYNAIKSLYGSFNLLIEYYLKKNKSLSTIITGGKRRRGSNKPLDQSPNESPIAEALGFYKILPEVWQAFTQGLSYLTMNQANDAEIGKRLFSTIQLYTSSRYYDLYMYLKQNTQDMRRYVQICNRLWRSYSDSTSGGISPRCKHIIQDFIREIIENIVTKIYIGETPKQLDEMSYIYNNIRSSSGSSLYMQSQYVNNMDVQMEMPAPDPAPTNTKSNIIDIYLEIVNLINQMIYSTPINSFNALDQEKEYKQSIDEYFQSRIDIYKKIGRSDQKQIFFQRFMSDPLIQGKTSISSQVDFIKVVGTQLNQLTVLIGQIIKTLIVYHKKYVELSNFPRAVAVAMKYKQNKIGPGKERSVYNLFTQFAGASYDPAIMNIIAEYQNLQNVDMSVLSKLEYDLANSDVLYTFILQKCLQMVEEQATGNDLLVDDAFYEKGAGKTAGGAAGGMKSPAQSQLLAGLIQAGIIQQYTDQKYLEGNLPFAGGRVPQGKQMGRAVGYLMFILSDEIFQYLQTHLPYLPNAYYETYSDYAEMISLLNQIPGIQINGGNINYNGMLNMLTQKKNTMLKSLDKFKIYAANSELFDYVKSHLSNGCDYTNFFLDVFRKYCPPPLPLSGFVSFNAKLNLFDIQQWAYYITNPMDCMGKISYQYQVGKDASSSKSGYLGVLCPFDLSLENYNSSIDIIGTDGKQSINVQINVVDQLNFLISRTIYKLKQYNTALPTSFVRDLTSNNVFSQALVTSQVELNGTIFNLPLNTLQMPFHCPIVFGLTSQDKIGSMINSLAQQTDIAQRLREEGCFFINDTINLFMAKTQNMRTVGSVPENIKQAYKNILDTIARTPELKPTDALEKFKSVPGFILGDINLSGIDLDIPDGKTVQQAFNIALYRTLYALSHADFLQKSMYYSTDQFYDWYQNHPIEQYANYAVSYVKVNADNKDRYKTERDNSQTQPGDQNVYNSIKDYTLNTQLIYGLSNQNSIGDKKLQQQTLILPLVINTPKGELGNGINNSPRQVNIIQSSKYLALSEMLKQKYQSDLVYSTIECIYNKELQRVEQFRLSENNSANYKIFRDNTNPVLYMSTVSMLNQYAPIEYTESQKFSILYDMVLLMRQVKDFQSQTLNTSITTSSGVNTCVNALLSAIRGVINKCKDILKKPGIGYDWKISQEQQTLFDPVLFTFYSANNANASDILARYKKLYIQYAIGEKSDASGEINQEIISTWFQINKLLNLQSRFPIFNQFVFRPEFAFFQRAAFIKKRTPSHQIIGEDHYWVLYTGNSPLMIKKDQPQYNEADSNLGWLYNLQKEVNGQIKINNHKIINIYDINSFIKVSDLQMINISDIPEWANLFRFQYALVCNINNRFQRNIQNIKTPTEIDDRAYQVPNNKLQGGMLYSTFAIQDQPYQKQQAEALLTEQKLKDMVDQAEKNETNAINQTRQLLINNQQLPKDYDKNLQETLISILQLGNQIQQNYNQFVNQYSKDQNKQIKEKSQALNSINNLVSKESLDMLDQLNNIVLNPANKDQSNLEQYDLAKEQANRSAQIIADKKAAEKPIQLPANWQVGLATQAKTQGGNMYGIIQIFINRVTQLLNDMGYDATQEYFKNIKDDKSTKIISPLSLMQEITFFAGITNQDTLNCGRDIYCVESDAFSTSELAASQSGNVYYYENSYMKLIKNPQVADGMQYNENARDRYLTSGNATIGLLACTPIQYLFQVMTTDYSLLSERQLNGYDARQFIFKILNIQPFNPISLIKANLPYPLMTAMSIYIQTYERKFLGAIGSSFGSGYQYIQLNQKYIGRPVYIICDNGNHPIASDNTAVTSIVVDVTNQNNQDIYYTAADGKSLSELRANQQTNGNRFPPISAANVERTSIGYVLKELNNTQLQTSINKLGTSSDSPIILKALFTIIPKYFYYNSRLLKQTFGSTLTQKYVVQPNGEIIQAPYKTIKYWQ